MERKCNDGSNWWIHIDRSCNITDRSLDSFAYEMYAGICIIIPSMKPKGQYSFIYESLTFASHSGLSAQFFGEESGVE